MSRYRSLGAAIRADIGLAIVMAAAACAAFAVTEYAATVVTYAGSTPFIVKLRLAGVVLGMTALGWLPLVLIASIVGVVPRLIRGIAGKDPRIGRGVLAFPLPTDRARPGPARLWAGFTTGLVTAGVLQRWAVWVAEHYKEKELVAAMIAVVGVLAVPIVLGAYRASARMLSWLASELDPALGKWSPIGRWRAAAIAFGLMIAAGLTVVYYLWAPGRSAWAAIPLEHFRAFPPWRTILPIAALAGGGIVGSWYASTLRPGRRRLTRKHAIAGAIAAAIVIPLSLFRWGADVETKYVAITASPALARAVDAIRAANDLDGDGFGSLMGENDCAPFNPAIHPGVRDVPDNGIDENCDGRDFSLRDLVKPAGDKGSLPDAYKKPWNVLLITIDTVRYDHTSFGGYRDGPKHRDTTPRLQELVNKAVSFTFCNAPSAGTMASVPAILTSKYFHSGIALEERKGKPPKLKPENLLIGEIMKSGGYSTGAITSHEYFNDWGMDQGMDSYDNEIGKDGDPDKITSSMVTDRAIAWISRQQGRKWFLWTHFIDPHGHYMPHPDWVTYGTSEEDKYDGELAYTDHHIGRLLDELARLPGGDRTIVVITSDHGDGFNEHGFINHGQALYRELLNVPLIFYIPNGPVHLIDGAVTNLDILPTIADLTGIDVSQDSFEGESLVSEIFSGKADMNRIVFSETNFPTPIRSATTRAQKLIYNLRNNVYELYDLAKDPWEKTNIYSKDPNAGARLHDELDRWLERVLYSRDPVFNQAAAKISDVLVKTAPTLAQPTNLTFDDGKLKILGVEYVDPTKLPKSGERTSVYVYFQVLEPTTSTYRFQIVAWPTTLATFSPTAPSTRAIRGPMRATLDGLFGTERWHKGDIIRDKWDIDVQKDWTGDAMGIGLVVDDGTRVTINGPHPGGDQTVVTLGTAPIARVGPITEPTPLPSVSVPLSTPATGFKP